MKYNNKVSAATIARTAALLLALANQILSAFGKSPLPIESSTVEQLVTTGITTVTALINWWYRKAEAGSLAANYVQASAYKKALERIINGDDYEKALADADAEWKAYLDEHIWD